MAKKDSDFNDLQETKGLKAVKEKIGHLVDAEKGRPFGQFIVRPDGVYQTKVDKETGDTEETYFCTRLEPEGIARSTGGQGFSLLLKMTDLDGKSKPWLLSFENIIRSGGEESRIAFVEQGGAFGPGTRERLAFGDLLKSFLRYARHLPRIVLADRSGWIDGPQGSAFVLPGETIGRLSNETVTLHDPGKGAPDYTPQGTLQSWQAKIGQYCRKNSRLLFACALSLAGPLLHLRGIGGGGFHLIGGSSSGKTTALHVAASVAGSPISLIKTCDSTANAFESTAAQHNDCALLMDELGQAHPEAIGQIVYKLAGGIGRGRADQNGNAPERKQWNILFLTNGETGLADMMKTAGRRVFTGQELRLADVEADSGQGFGLFEELHGFAGGAALSDHLREAAAHHHGHLLREYLIRLVEEVNSDKPGLLRWLNEVENTFTAQAVPPAASGQVCRVAARFALVAAGGELATRYGLTGWQTGEVLAACVTCFESWLSRRGTAGLGEVGQLIAQVTSFFERFGESRFQPMESKTRGTPPPNRAGFRDSVNIGHGFDLDQTAHEYFVLPSVFRDELCVGFDPRWAAKVLIEKGLLKPGTDGKTSSVYRLPGMGAKRVYHFPADSGPDEKPENAEKE